MKTIIITGSSGFIGSNLKEYLKPYYKIIGIDRVGCTSKNEKNFYLRDINESLPDLKDEEIYAVVHLAARAGVRGSQEYFEKYVKDNILATKAIIDKCIEFWKPKKILMASSSSIYGDFNEGYHPKSLYGMTKVSTEQILNTYMDNGLLEDVQASVLRIHTVYGPGQRKGLAMRNFINNILQDKPITVYGDGTQRRDFTYIDDLCDRINTLLKEECDFDRMIDLGNNRSYSINNIIYLISKITGKDVTIHYEPMNRFDVKDTSLDDGYYIKTPIEEGLKRQIEWQKKELAI